MKNKIITVDCDNVLSDTNNYFVHWFNKKYDENVTYDEVVDPYFGRYVLNKYPHIHDNDYEFYELFAKDFYGDIQPHFINGSQEGVRKLKDLGYDLYVLTGRHDDSAHHTSAWIEKYYPGMFTDIIYTNESMTINMPKGEVCKKLGSSAHIDDFLHNAINISEYNIPTYLFDTPWNQTDEVLSEHIYRIGGRKDVLSHIQK